MNIKNKYGPLITILLIIFVDILGFTLMIPLLPFYAQSLGATPLQVGILSSSYGLCSLLAGPILGDLSDNFGRKKILLLSQIGTFIGFVILIFSHSLIVVFLSRIIDGFTSGNITVAQAYISDTTAPEDRTKAMGLIGATFGLGFIIGPALASLLLKFGNLYPFYFASLFSLMSILGTIIFLKETDRNLNLKFETNFLTHFKNSFKMFFDPNLKKYFTLFFIFSISFSFYFGSIALFAERTFYWKGHHFTASEVGVLMSYIGLVAFLIQIFGMDVLVRKFGELKIIKIGFFFTCLAFFTISTFPIFSIFMFAITINTIGNAILRPAISGMLSKNATNTQQGIVFGISQTLMSIANIICPIISGQLIGLNLNNVWCLLIAITSLIGFFYAQKISKI